MFYYNFWIRGNALESDNDKLDIILEDHSNGIIAIEANWIKFMNITQFEIKIKYIESFMTLN